MKIGFVGLGNLGMPIAENILANTKQLFVYNRTASKAQPLLEKGAVLSDSVKAFRFYKNHRSASAFRTAVSCKAGPGLL